MISLTKFKIILFTIILNYNSLPAPAQTWEGLSNGADDNVRKLYYDSTLGKLFIGGGFSNMGGLSARGIVSYDGSNFDSLQSGMDAALSTMFSGNVFAIQRFQNHLYVGGIFNSAGNVSSKNIARWNGMSWDTFSNSINSAVLDMKVFSNELYVCGSFDTVSGYPVNGLAKWNDSVWSDVNNLPNFNAHLNSGNLISSIELYQSNLYVAGNFEDVNSRKEITYWNGTSWIALDNGIFGSIAWVNCMTIYKNELYVGGLFHKANGNNGNSIMKWNGINWSDVGNGIGGVSFPQVNKMFVYDSYLYVLGYFNTAGNIPCSSIAKWDGTQWCALSGQFDNIISTIEAYNDSLFIGGAFWTIDSDSMNCISKWIGGNHTDTCSILFNNLEEEINTYKINIYPNPSKENLTIKSIEIINKISINDILGNELYSKKLSDISSLLDISFLKNGLYFLIIETKYSRGIKKFVKN